MRQVPESPSCHLSLCTRHSKHRRRNKHSLSSAPGEQLLDALLFLEKDPGPATGGHAVIRSRGTRLGGTESSEKAEERNSPRDKFSPS